MRAMYNELMIYVQILPMYSPSHLFRLYNQSNINLVGRVKDALICRECNNLQPSKINLDRKTPCSKE